MSRLSRRGILGGAAALVPAAAVGVGATPSPVQPDAALIAASARFVTAERIWRDANLLVARCRAGDPNEPALEAEADRLGAIRDELLDPVMALPCTTAAGVRAIAEALVEWDQELLKDTSDYTNDRLMVRLVVAVLGTRGAL